MYQIHAKKEKKQISPNALQLPKWSEYMKSDDKKRERKKFNSKYFIVVI